MAEHEDHGPVEGVAVDVHADGLLWLVNRTVFHPRGFALGHTPGTDEWRLYGDGSEPWQYAEPVDEDRLFAAAEAALARARGDA